MLRLEFEDQRNRIKPVSLQMDIPESIREFQCRRQRWLRWIMAAIVLIVAGGFGGLIYWNYRIFFYIGLGAFVI